MDFTHILNDIIVDTGDIDYKHGAIHLRDGGDVEWWHEEWWSTTRTALVLVNLILALLLCCCSLAGRSQLNVDQVETLGDADKGDESEWQVDGLSPSERFLLVTAHPDDESMFFVPFLRWAKGVADEQQRQNGGGGGGGPVGEVATVRSSVTLLVLSTGNADGLGATRVDEMRYASSLLHLRRLVQLDEPTLADGTAGQPGHWTPEQVAAAVADALTDETTVVTFDDYGVSGHADHQACAAGVRLAVQRHKGRHLRHLSLLSVSLARKFLGPWQRNTLSLLLDVGPSIVRVDTGSLSTSIQAMCAHWSQFRWFRLLFVLFSTYTYSNIFIDHSTTDKKEQ